MFERFVSRDTKSTLSTLSLFLFFIVSMALLSALMSSRANAQAATLATDPGTLAISAEEKTTTKPFVYAAQVYIETARSADESAPTNYTGWYMGIASATHRATSLTATARVGYTREYSYERDDRTNGSFDNPILTISKSFINGEHYNMSALDSISISLNGSIGANNESARRTFLWSNGLLLTGTKNIGRFSLRQAFGYSRSFFEYDIRGDGTVNSPDSFKSITTAYYNLTDRLSFGGIFTYAYALSFQKVGRGTQLAMATIDYAFTDKIAASLGITSERATIEPDGQSDRIRMYAPEAAQYFVDVILTL